jgi:lysophospholipase L1-like esterase
MKLFRADRLKKLSLLLAGCGVGFLLIEVAYRLVDPFPYYPPWQINVTEHGNLSQYDAELGWKGVPNARELFVTHNARVWLEHNGLGFRDIPAEDRSPDKPALVFLGDSFTWGFEVAFDDMFVNLIRRELDGREVFNLAHRGYGTDQSLLTFRRWREARPLDRVVLMFSENDPEENNSDFEYSKPKPKFEVVADELVLTGVPVPRSESWRASRDDGDDRKNVVEYAAYLAYRSHFLHDMSHRLKGLFESDAVPTVDEADLELTRRLLSELRDEVAGRGGRLAVVAIPSKLELMSIDGYVPYQHGLRPLCAELDVDYLDLGPAFGSAWLGTYYRAGMHWNRRGHAVAARAILDFLNRPERTAAPEGAAP